MLSLKLQKKQTVRINSQIKKTKNKTHNTNLSHACVCVCVFEVNMGFPANT